MYQVHLDLNYNLFKTDGVGRLAGGLRQCQALSCLILEVLELGQDGAGSVAGVLMQCPALAHLDVRDNYIEADGAVRIAEVLIRCPALVHLDLSRNSIRDDGGGKRKKHGSWANLKGGGQLAAKAGNGAQMRGMVPGLGSVSGCPHSPEATSARCVWTQVHAGVVARYAPINRCAIGVSCSTSSRGGRRAL